MRGVRRNDIERISFMYNKMTDQLLETRLSRMTVKNLYISGNHFSNRRKYLKVTLQKEKNTPLGLGFDDLISCLVVIPIDLKKGEIYM